MNRMLSSPAKKRKEKKKDSHPIVTVEFAGPIKKSLSPFKLEEIRNRKICNHQSNWMHATCPPSLC